MSLVEILTHLLNPVNSVCLGFLILLFHISSYKNDFVDKRIFLQLVAVFIISAGLAVALSFFQVADDIFFGLSMILGFSVLFYFSERDESSRFRYFILTVCVTSIIWLPIRIFWDISAHTTFGIVPFVTLGFLDKRLYPLAAIGLVAGYTRIALGIHTPLQVLAGVLLGILVPFLIRKKFDFSGGI